MKLEDVSRTQLGQAERLLKELLLAMQSYDSNDRHIPLIFANLIRVYMQIGDFQQAVDAATRCYQSIRDQNRSIGELALACNNLAVAHRYRGNLLAATETFGIALEYAQQTSAADGQKVEAVIRFNRGVLGFVQRRWAEAEDDLRVSLDIHQQVLGPTHGIIGDLTNNLGIIAYHQKHFEQAETYFKRALETWDLALGSMSTRIAIGRCNLAALYRALSYFTEAEWIFQRALRVFDRQNEFRDTPLDPFFANLLESPSPGWRPWLGPEVGLLHAVTLYEEPLTIDMPNASEQLAEYSSWLDQLRPVAAKQELQATIDRHGPWYHNLQVGAEIWTNLEIGNHPEARWRLIEPFVPTDLSGKTVLDIGCNAGYFSLQMKRRGARRVLGVDVMAQVLAQARFMSTWEQLPIQLREMDTYDVESLGPFDYVIFVGVLYHLKHPLYALEKVANVCRDTMFFQSVIHGPSVDFDPKDDYPDSEKAILDKPEFPKLYFIEKSFNRDVSNWWFATQSCLKAMLRTVGFREIIPTAGPDTFICRK